MKKIVLLLAVGLIIVGLLLSIGVAQIQKVPKPGSGKPTKKAEKLLFYYSFDNCKDIAGLPHCNCKSSALECSDGVKKQAVMFKGKGDYITQKNNATRSFTVTFWMRTKDVGANTEGGKFYGCTGLIDAWSADSDKSWGINLCGDKIGFGVGDTTIHSDSPVNIGKYVFVAATRDFATGNIKLYLNGKLEAQAKDVAKSVVLDGSPDIYIGALHAKLSATSVRIQQFYFGCLDELKVYDGVLSADKIKKMYDALNPYKIKPKPQIQKQQKETEPDIEGLPR